MSSANRDKTLSEYLAMLRRGSPVILLTGVVCAAVAVAVSLLQKPSYQAQASLAVQDPNQALALAGGAAGATQTQLQLSLSYAPQVTRAQVVRAVKRELKKPLSESTLRQSVSVSVDPNSALIDIAAQSGSATEAAAIANSFARMDSALTNSQARSQYALEAQHLSRKLTGAASKDPTTRLAYVTQLSRLQTLSSVATPLQVNSSARVPSVPSSPRPVRNGLAALAFGLLLGMALVYGRTALDSRFGQPSDVEQVLAHPVVGHVRVDALGHVGARSNTSVNGSVPLKPADEESFRVLRQNVRYFSAEPLRTVLVTSAAAKEGKSTVAACLAATTVSAGQRTLLVECDLRRPVLSTRLGLPAGPGLTDYLTGNAGPADVLRSVPIIHARSESSNGRGNGAKVHLDEQKLVCIPAGRSAPQPTELLASDSFRRFLQEVDRVYDMVILDSAPLLSVADTLELVPNASAVLLCVRLRQTTRDQVRAAQAALDRLPSCPVGVVITGLRDSDAGYYGYDDSYYRAAATA
jgi:capsular polysaccharide biosynthesis protein/Mrp family chromosome partitioning ATPase